jgi:hypothetical protein
MEMLQRVRLKFTRNIAIKSLRIMKGPGTIMIQLGQ